MDCIDPVRFGYLPFMNQQPRPTCKITPRGLVLAKHQIPAVAGDSPAAVAPIVVDCGCPQGAGSVVVPGDCPAAVVSIVVAGGCPAAVHAMLVVDDCSAARETIAVVGACLPGGCHGNGANCVGCCLITSDGSSCDSWCMFASNIDICGLVVSEGDNTDNRWVLVRHACKAWSWMPYGYN